MPTKKRENKVFVISQKGKKSKHTYRIGAASLIFTAL